MMIEMKYLNTLKKLIFALVLAYAGFSFASDIDEKDKALESISIAALSEVDALAVIKISGELKTLNTGDSILDSTYEIEAILEDKLVVKELKTGEQVYLWLTQKGKQVKVQRLSRSTPKGGVSESIRTHEINLKK